jgi:Topoisomerase 6 subunit A/Spo11, Toprim domain
MKSDKIIGAVQSVTKKWAKQRKREEREASAASNRRYVMTRRRHISIKEAAWCVMEEAYLKASGGGKLPAHARQIMYAARGPIQKMSDRTLGNDFDKYFTQQILPNYIEEEEGVDWNVVFDARGHFHEPHTGLQVPLGTLQVRKYLNRIDKHEVEELDFSISEKHYPTVGPENGYGAVLFIEKEGFFPLFEEVKLAERYDLAIMSTKGMSVTAARELIDTIGADVPILVLHDFDKSGFSIVGTLQRDTRRYSFSGDATVVDIGLRLDDVQAEGLVSEAVYDRGSTAAVSRNLRENGATDPEIAFLLNSRVELNAFASDQFIDWIERKLKEHGVTKVVPNDEVLADAYHRMRRQAAVQVQIDKALEELGEEESTSVPGDLRSRIEAAQKANPERRWDELLRDIADGDHEDY